MLDTCLVLELSNCYRIVVIHTFLEGQFTYTVTLICSRCLLIIRKHNKNGNKNASEINSPVNISACAVYNYTFS